MNRYCVFRAAGSTQFGVLYPQFEVPSGFSFIVDLQTMQIFEAATIYFLSSRANKRYPDGYPSSVVGETQDLRDYLEYCDHFKIPWQDAHNTDIENYRDLLLKATSPKTWKPYSVKTVRRRMSVVIGFYRFASRHHWCTTVTNELRQEAYHRNSNSVVLVHTSSHSTEIRSSSLQARDKTEIGHRGRPIPIDHLKAILRIAGDLAGAAAGHVPRLRLACETSLHTGLRREEICSLNCDQIEQMNLQSKGKSQEDRIWLRLERTKGQQAGSVGFPVWLIELLHAYISGARQEIVGACGPEDLGRGLFLNSIGTRNVGGTLKKDTLSESFRSAVVQAGFYSETTREDPLTGELKVFSEAHYTFHDLRHTFAALLYIARTAEKDPSPWKYIQVMLRHKLLSTTMEIYCRTLPFFESDVTDSVLEYTKEIYNSASG